MICIHAFDYSQQGDRLYSQQGYGFYSQQGDGLHSHFTVKPHETIKFHTGFYFKQSNTCNRRKRITNLTFSSENKTDLNFIPI